MAKMITCFPGGPPGILDEDLASILDMPTRRLNQALKRNTLNFEKDGLGYRITWEEYRQMKPDPGCHTWGGRRRLPPILYTFQGVCLVIGRLRICLRHAQRDRLLGVFGEQSIQVYGYGAGRAEEHIVSRLETLLRGITRVLVHYSVSCNGYRYSIDVYLPDHRIAVEVDEEQHEYRRERDEIRQARLQQKLGCVFVRIRFDDDFDSKLNEILKWVLRIRPNDFGTTA